MGTPLGTKGVVGGACFSTTPVPGWMTREALHKGGHGIRDRGLVGFRNGPRRPGDHTAVWPDVVAMSQVSSSACRKVLIVLLCFPAVGDQSVAAGWGASRQLSWWWF